MKLVAVFVALVTLASGGFQGLPPLRAAVFTAGLQAPVAFVADPTDPSIFYAVEQGGRIRVVRNRVVAEDFLDLRTATVGGGERGLLGMALAPDFPSSGRFYVNFTNTNGDTVVARFKRSNGTVDPASRFDLKWGPERSPVILQPFVNHNGGHLAFGPDGYLYIGLGDGGSGDDPQNNAQTPSTLLGKMLRIDVVGRRQPSQRLRRAGRQSVRQKSRRPACGRKSGRSVCVTPGDTASTRSRSAVRARSWWGTSARISGKRSTTSRRRGAAVTTDGACVKARNRIPNPATHTPPPAFQPLIDPVQDYGRSQGTSVTGGFVYRGHTLGDAFRGRYFFADYVQQRVWSVGFASARW